MDDLPPAVLKKHQTRAGEPMPVTVVGGMSMGIAGAAAATAAVSAKIVEQNETHAVVEVVCSCGRRVYINCECRPAGPAARQAQ